MKIKGYSLILVFMIFLFLPSLAFTASMSDYCIVPPYVKRDISVNILIIMDNSNDMNGRAYTSSYSSSTTYIGYFDPDGCYEYDTAGHNNRWYRMANATSFTCSDSSHFPGNLLNWATMSRFSVLKRVLIGGNLQPQVSYCPNYIVSEGGGWNATVGGCTYTVSTSSRLTTSGTCPDTLTNALLNIDINYAAPAQPCASRQPYEAVNGILQTLNDTNKDLNPDTNSPRTGLIDFGANDTPRTNQCLPFQNTLQAFLNSIAQGSTVTSSALANAEKLAVNYYIDPASGTGCTTKDPFLTCASWESSCTGAVPCRRSFILILSTGSNVSNTASYPPYEPGTTCDYVDASYAGTSTQPLVKNACYAANTDLRNDASLEPANQYVYTYAVHTFGSTTNENVLRATASAGQGEYYSAGETNLEDVIKQAFQDIIRRAASGTAASVLASGEGQGANLIQAVFYPRTPSIQTGGILFNERIEWVGRLVNSWYHVDPFFGTSALYEDNASSNVLDLSDDNKIQLYFDIDDEKTKAERLTGTDPTPIELEKLKSLWEAGVELWKRDLTSSPRTIYTTTDGTSLLTGNFSTGNAGSLRTYFDLSTSDSDIDGYADGDLDRDGDVDDADAERLIQYIHGEDFDNLRSRTTAVDLNGDDDVLDTDESEKVWKLGDVLNSTPKTSSWIQLNTYDSVYIDTTYRDFLDSSNYTSRGMVFTGANDGMLHAFKLGGLELDWSGRTSTQKARLTGSDLGKEMWAFIPKNALPYLKYIAESGYCHIYTVDLTPYIFDASIGEPASGDVSTVTKTVSHWRTILIGGMRFGGACKSKNVNCSTDTPNSVCAPAEVSGASVGFSSYFALDVTDQNNPTLLWEFSNSQLGFTTTGPAVVRIGSDTSKNGKWFVVFGSGPTGPISTTDQQFMGNSDQNLRLFVLDLKTGSLLRTIDTGIQYAFAGSMLNVTIDTDLDYQDDAVFIGYVKKCLATTTVCTVNTWTDGGAGRLLTKEDTNPGNWAWNAVIDNIGPVTSSVARLQNKKTGKLWLYFGTGRYYFEQSATVDDGTTQRRLFGIKDPCFQGGAFDASCSDTAAISDMIDKTCPGALTICLDASIASNKDGWYIDLDPASPPPYIYCEGGTGTCPGTCTGSCVSRSYRAERVITDPLATTAGIVFFTTYKPYNDVCAFGGKTFIWAVKYDTGGAAGALLKGIALLQVSTGSIEQIDLSTAFTDRKSVALEGVPPTAQGLSILSTPPPVKRVIHMRER